MACNTYEMTGECETDPWYNGCACQPEQPTWSKNCDCGGTVERWRGEGDVTCSRGRCEYNAGGQRLRDDWRGNPSNYDSDISDLEGYEIQHAGEDW